MYSRRIKIFIGLTIIFLAVCLLRLIHLQWINNSVYQKRIELLKLQKGRYKPLKTLRGKILDRNGKVLAIDKPLFKLYISYELTSFMDERVRKSKLLKVAKQTDDTAKYTEVENELQTGLEDLNRVIDKCTHFGLERKDIEDEIKKINDWIWDLRVFHAWGKNCKDSEVYRMNKDNLISVKTSVMLKDFEKEISDPNRRLELIYGTNILEMHQDHKLLELKTKGDVFTAQIEFANVKGIDVKAEGTREYPYNSIAAQTIGWVSPVSGREDEDLFEGDKLRNYLSGEVCGREDGVEYVCETALRGRRGEMFYDIDGQPTKIETQLGRDVQLTLDIDFQKKIEGCLTDCNQNVNCRKPMAAVVLDVETGDVLSLVSLPSFDLNIIRQKYDSVSSDQNEPLRNRAINKQYPPGSSIKPVVLIAGLESGKIASGEVIPCTSQRPGKGWPRCWIQKKYGSLGHSDWWYNSAKNAIKGSCNIYFSRLAEKIDSIILQKWYYNFGYGKKILFPPSDFSEELERNFNQVHGQISDVFVSPLHKIQDFSDIPPLSRKSERRWFGIGQGNLRASPLQVANSMAAIARRGVFKEPRLFVNQRNTPVSLEISKQTMDVIWAGMRAVVSENHGTAYDRFADADFDKYEVKVYGKTGSTERPANAWFAGFAQDSKNHGIAFSVLVEGGNGGAEDAAPLARKIIQFCIDSGYIGNNNNP